MYCFPYSLITKQLHPLLYVEYPNHSQSHYILGKWEGRCWDIEDFIISLNYQSKLQLTIYPQQYLAQSEREVQLQTNSNNNTN